MKHRKLRIAWSVAWGVAAVLSVALWVRSYHRADLITCRFISEQTYYVVSCRGQFGVVPLPLETNQGVDPDGNKVFPLGWVPMPLSATGTIIVPNGKVTVQGFTNYYRTGEHWGWDLTPIVLAPIWMIALPAITICAFAALPFMKRAFSLRTLLIATTLVAVGLGLIVWLAR